ncbi:hypothetical protein CASFOL_034516 [Castilleja foliolosa]|uniref:Uncharacterized protein n=1 Tax=Castilleja foliolosa TaxID=1961234 RepID=A0ABD3BRH2_9LAMI
MVLCASNPPADLRSRADQEAVPAARSAPPPGTRTNSPSPTRLSISSPMRGPSSQIRP